MAVLVIDVGSSSVRALLFDFGAQLIAGTMAARAHQLHPQTGECDVVQLQQQVEDCIDVVLRHPTVQSGATVITAVAMASFVGNVLGVDATHTPITPLYTYADTRSHEDVGLLGAVCDGAAVYQRTGCPLHTAYHPARLHWLRRTQPALFGAVVTWLDVGTYLYRRWFDDADVPCSTSVASWSGLQDRQQLIWDAELLRVLGLEASSLPRLADFSAAQVGLSAAYATRWQALRDVPFFLAVGDGAAANIGMGADDAHTLALTVGTTAALRIVTPAAPVIPAGLWAYRVDARRHLVGGATTEGGNIFQWVRQTFALSLDGDTLDAALLAAPAAAHGLTFLPLLSGERSPGWRADARGTLHGITLATTPFDVLQAALEGVANRLATIADQLQLAADVPVVAGGGALEASPAWAQMMANALHRPLTLLAEPETTARGAAILALSALGHHAALSPARIRQTVMPQAEAVSRLAAARARQADLYARLYNH